MDRTLPNFLLMLPSLRPPASVHSTGGSISNFYMLSDLCDLARCLVAVPRTNAEPLASQKKLDVKYVPTPLSYPSTVYLTWDYWAWKYCNTVKINEKPDVVLASTAAIPAGHALSRRLGSLFVPLCRDYQNFFEAQNKSLQTKTKNAILKTYHNRRTTRAFAQADRVICNSEHLKQRLKGHFSLDDKISVLYPPIDVPEEPVRRLPKSWEKLVIGYITKGPHKGDELISQLANDNQDLRFRIWGRRPPCGLTSDNVHFQGWDAKRSRIYRSCDILLIPSQWDEPFGRVAAEALIAGCTVLTSGRGGLSEIINDSYFHVSCDTTESWAQALYRVVGTPELSYEKTLSMQERASTLFAPNRHREQLSHIVQSLF